MGDMFFLKLLRLSPFWIVSVFFVIVYPWGEVSFMSVGSIFGNAYAAPEGAITVQEGQGVGSGLKLFIVKLSSEFTKDC